MLHYTEAIGLDIGSHAAKTVRVKRRWGRFSTEDALWVRLPEDPDERQRVLESFVTKNGWRGLPCVVSPSLDGVMLQSIYVPPHDPRPIASIVDLEMSQLSGLSEATTVRDFAVSRDGNGKRILLAVGRVDSVQAAIDLAVSSGLRPVQVTPQAVALFNSVSRQWRRSRKSKFIIIDVGHRCTTVVVGTRSKLIDARHIPIGGAALGHGLQTIGSTESGLAAAELANWLDALAACLAVCEGTRDAGNPALTPEAIVLTGGGAHIEGLKQGLASQFEKPTFLLGDIGRQSHMEHPERMALATGLAMAGTGTGNLRLNLLPAAIREAITLHSQARYWIASGIALTVAMLAILTGAGLELQRKQDNLASARDRLNHIQADEARLTELKQQNDLLEAQIRPFASLVHNGDILRTAVGAISKAKHADDWLTRIADSASCFVKQPPAPAGILPFRRLVVEGYTPATDLSTVRSMIEALRTSPGILDADILGDDARLPPPPQIAKHRSTPANVLPSNLCCPRHEHIRHNQR